ncbi:MAG: hypothetical protein IT222_02085 [Crocinitomix sp.]|nr:hypothetical protein [Crocinitomix sp.]
MAEETHYTANTGMVTISTANSNLDGTGTLGTVLTGANNGTLIKSVFIKAQGSTQSGMVRLFIFNGSSSILLHEIYIPENAQASVNKSFEIQLDLNITLKSGFMLRASTQQGNTFNIIAEGMDWSYYSSQVRTDTTQQITVNGRASISTSNSNLDGTGSLGTAYTAGSSSNFNGSSIRTITIKSTVNVSSGMIRVFLQNLSSQKFLLTEILVDTETKSALDESFERTVLFEDDLDIQAGYSILVSTQQSENFRIEVEGTNWKYAS